MKRIINILLAIVVIGCLGIEAKTTKKSGKKKSISSKSVTTNYKFETTDEGFKSPIGHTYYLGKLAWNTEKCYMSFITPDKIEIFAGPKSNRVRVQYAWKQDGNFIFISDFGEPLKLSDDGKSLTGVYTGTSYTISGNVPIKDKNSENKIYSGMYTWWLSPDGKIVSSTYPQSDFSPEITVNSIKVLEDSYLICEYNYQINDLSPKFLINNNAAYEFERFRKDKEWDENDWKNFYYLESCTNAIYTPENNTVTLKDVRASNYDNGEKINTQSFTLPLNYFRKAAELWDPKANDIKADPQKGTFTLNGTKYIITEKGQAYSSNRDQSASIGRINDSAYLFTIGYGSIIPAEGYDQYLVVDNNLYSMPTDTGIEININYDPTSKKVIITSSDEYYNETKPLSKYPKAAAISIVK